MNARIRIKAARDQALEEVSRLREEIRIKDARTALINPHRRPHYPPTERLAIRELKAARGWSLEQTARVFHVTAAFSLRIDFQKGRRHLPFCHDAFV